MTRCNNTSLLESLVSNPRSPKPLAAFLSRLVAEREERDRINLFYCDGIRFVHHAATSRHVRPKLFVYAPELSRRHPGVQSTMDRIRERHPTVPLFPLPAEMLSRLSQSPEPQGIGAVVEQTWTPLYRLPPDAGLCYVALDTVQNPGNFGTILRTLEAVGGAGLICLPASEPDAPPVDPFAPGVVRAGMGSTFGLRFARTGGAEWQSWREKHGVRLIGTSPHTGEDFRSVRYGERVVLWMGGERKGLTDEQMAQCDHLVRIPMAPTATADSLNLAMATSILLYELFTQRSPTPGYPLGAPPSFR
ncbi:MAG: RNA methyltransferase [Fibrella sp.]|nr:RNA methyltransferase [Armatimonadota bacterium]